MGYGVAGGNAYEWKIKVFEFLNNNSILNVCFLRA